MLKVGVLGAGHLGKIHLRLLQQSDQYELVGFYDENQENAERISKEFGYKNFSTIAKLIHAVDVIDIVTPTLSHYKCAKVAIKSGKHIFIEKPIANTVEEAEEIIALAKEYNVKGQVGHVERFNPAFIATKNMIENPMFIETHRLAEFNPRGTDVPVVLDLMIHDIDIILSIVKSDVKSVSSSGVAVLTDTPDIANVRIEFNNGCVANLTSSRISMKKMRKMRLFQKDGYIGIDFLNKTVEILKLKKDEDINTFNFDLETPKGTRTIAISNPPIPEVNAIKKELEEFVSSIQNKTPTIVSEIDGYRAMEVAHQILQKINNHITAT